MPTFLYIVLLEHANLNCYISWKINFYHNKISRIFLTNLASCSIFICEIKLNRIAYLISSISIVLICVGGVGRMRAVCLCLVYMQICRFCIVWLHVHMHEYVHMEAWGDVENHPLSTLAIFSLKQGLSVKPRPCWYGQFCCPITLGSLVCISRGWNYRWADIFNQNQQKFLGIWISVLILVQQELYLLNYLPYPVSILLNMNT